MTGASLTVRRHATTALFACGLLLGTAAHVSAADDVLEGRSTRLAWHAEYLQLDTRVVEGKARDSYRFVLVLKNVSAEPLVLTACRYSWSLLSIGTEPMSVSFEHTLAPGAEIRIPFEALLECFGGPGACRAPTGPHWLVEYTGHLASGGPVREIIDVTLPPRPGAKSIPVPKLVVRSDTSTPAGTTTAVPFQLKNRLMVLKATAGEQPISFALDTGAQLTILTPEAATRLGLGASAEIGRMPVFGVGTQTVDAPIVVLPSFRVGGYVFENLPAGIVPLFGGTSVVDGLLGADFMDAFKITIDRKAKELRLELSR